MTGPLPEFLDFALARGATSIELYPFEWYVANGNDPRWAPYRDGYDEALSAAAARLRQTPVGTERPSSP